MEKSNSGYIHKYAHGYKSYTVPEHTIIATEALGKHLPDSACVHHVDYDKTNNVKSNLVICQDDFYHALLHTRTDALRACGYVHYLKCCYCKLYDHPDNIKTSAHHTVRHKYAYLCVNRLKTKKHRGQLTPRELKGLSHKEVTP
jgi:hypothetical protein